MILVSICHIGWTEKDFKNMWQRLAKENPPQKQDFTANRKIEKRLDRNNGIVHSGPARKSQPGYLLPLVLFWALACGISVPGARKCGSGENYATDKLNALADTRNAVPRQWSRVVESDQAVALPLLTAGNEYATYNMLREWIEYKYPDYRVVFINDRETLLSPGAEMTWVGIQGLTIWMIKKSA